MNAYLVTNETFTFNAELAKRFANMDELEKYCDKAQSYTVQFYSPISNDLIMIISLDEKESIYDGFKTI